MRKMNWKILASGTLTLVTLIALVLLSAVDVHADVAAQTQGDVAAGRTQFQQTCQGCHAGGGTQQGRGPSLVGRGLTDERIRTAVRNGRGIMPAFPADRVSDAQLTNLVAYVLALPGSAQAQTQTTTAPAGATTAAATTTRAATTTAAVPQGGVPATGIGGMSEGAGGFNPAWLLLPLALASGLSTVVLVARSRRSRS